MALVQDFEHFYQASLEKMNHLQDAILRLRLEETSRDEENLQQINSVVEFLSEKVLPHFQKEESKIFPFVELHIPKLEPVVGYLGLEHEDFRHNLDSLRFSLQEVKNPESVELKKRFFLNIEQVGTYLFHLFRNHVNAEKQGLLQVIEKTLNEEEKEELNQLF